MKAFLVIAVMGLILGAMPAMARAASAAPITVGATCSKTGSSTINGKLLKLGPNGLTMTVDGGSGPLLAFGSAKLLLQVASNAVLARSLRSGDTVVVHAVNCPNAERTVLTTVVATVAVKARHK